MKRQPVRMPRWILAGMPAVCAALWLGHTAGSGVLFMWLLLGLVQRQPRYPYPRKSRPFFSRLFFAFSGGAFVIILFSGWFPDNAAYPGTAALAMLTASFLWQCRLPKRWQIISSIVMLFIACM